MKIEYHVYHHLDRDTEQLIKEVVKLLLKDVIVQEQIVRLTNASAELQKAINKFVKENK